MTTNRTPAPAAQRQPGKLAQFLRKNTVFVIALLAAGVTAFFVPPDAQYLSYFDWKTLSCLFCTLAVICALRNIHFFTVVAHKIVGVTGNIRRAIIAIIMITFIGSMLIANDMALLTFLPLGYHVLASSGQKKHMVFTFIMQNIGANLGGMLTPFGNPQNLYLYNKFQIPTAKFMGIMAIPFAAAIFLILVCCLILIRPEPIRVENQEDDRLPVGRTVLYLLLFAFSIVIVFRLIPYYIGLIVIPAVLLFADRKALRNVDYFLLLTFACFFVFSGNMARIDGVNRVLSSLMAKNPLIVSILSCQVISNVPSAILLYGFTTEYRALLYGVNIGGTGTLIASLASLITFRQYTALEPAGTKRYLGVFTLLNFLFLAVMTGVCVLLLQ